MIRLFFLLAALALAHCLPAQMLRVSANRRFLVTENGSPFFWLGDTGWELFHRLSKEDALFYLNDRAAKGFNVVMAVVLSEMNGLSVPNREGHLPLVNLDPEQPNEAYFRNVDFLVREAKKLGLYMALVPTWGAHMEDKPHPLFDNHAPFTDENSRVYGRFLGRRYKDDGNIIWVLGGDRSPAGNEKKWIALGEGIREGGARQLMTYHPVGGETSSASRELAPLLHFNMLQSGHERIGNSNYALIQKDYALEPAKPVFDAEPNYEEAPVGFDPVNGRFSDFHVRNAAYWSVFAGGFGINYGHNSVWQMYTPEKDKPVVWPLRGWKDALNAPGSSQLRHLKNLLLSRPFLNRIPDQGLTTQPQTERTNHIQITRDGTAGKKDATYILVYYAYQNGLPVKTDVINSPKLRSWWFNPRTGAAMLIGETENKGSFTVPWAKRIQEDESGPDWVLVIDDASRNYGPPGTITVP